MFLYLIYKKQLTTPNPKAPIIPDPALRDAKIIDDTKSPTYTLNFSVNLFNNTCLNINSSAIGDIPTTKIKQIK